ncbi:hypothetical protein SAMN05660742_12266 [Propionispira arboris]|uniref:Uncharacterized protein n=1 Tax=Propionispira arboris TaxID=84035 RepID=A0A1H7CVA7_9FIRM|nr:hypothetical protein [Propionispira arboris]SEJ89755.1 hypothetical protein SAMN05660742_12266 [Propionispira arboris]
MDASVLATAFGGACAGAIVTGFMSMWLSKKHYRDDYYKKILDKRIDAYDEVYLFLRGWSEKKEFIKDGEKYAEFFCMFVNEDELGRNIKQMQKVIRLEQWLNSETVEILHEINIFLEDTYILIVKRNNDILSNKYLCSEEDQNKFNHYKNNLENVKANIEAEYENTNINNIIWGGYLCPMVMDLYNEIYFLVNEDMKTLYKVDDFLLYKQNKVSINDIHYLMFYYIDLKSQIILRKMYNVVCFWIKKQNNR